jgi:hypothetical protein
MATPEEQSVLEAEIALKQLTTQPDQRKLVFDKALKLCEELEDSRGRGRWGTMRR